MNKRMDVWGKSSELFRVLGKYQHKTVQGLQP